MVDEFHELVPAVDVIGLTRLGNSSSLYEKYLDVLERHGLSGARASLERMLVIDHLISNRDRHWGNFGVIVDSETREWVCPAPLFDMGESLWCDRAFSPTLAPYRLRYKTPFLTRPGDQMARYVRGAAWELAADASDVIDGVLESCTLAPSPARLPATSTWSSAGWSSVPPTSRRSPALGVASDSFPGTATSTRRESRTRRERGSRPPLVGAGASIPRDPSSGHAGRSVIAELRRCVNP